MQQPVLSVAVTRTDTAAKPSDAAAIEADAIAALPDAGPTDEAAVAASPTTSEEDGPPAFDESAESEFRAEAQARGEPIVAVRPVVEVEDNDPKNLPPLESLIQRIPAEVRDTLEELFRARFVRVQRVPKRALQKTES